jgi:hypothetical protein
MAKSLINKIMKEVKQCPYCGEEILAVAKKCKHCGEWLDKEINMPQKKMIECPVCAEEIEEGLKICPHCKEQLESSVRQDKVEHKEYNSSDYSDIKNAIQQVIKLKIASAIISIGDHWVQFGYAGEEKFLFAAGSSKTDSKDSEFRKLKLRKTKNGDNTYYYKKCVAISSIDQTIQETKTIFETIYGVSFNSYEIEEEKYARESFFVRDKRWLKALLFAGIGWALFFFGGCHLVLGEKMSKLNQFLHFLGTGKMKQDFLFDIGDNNVIAVRINEGYWGFVWDNRFFDAPFIQWMMLVFSIGAFFYALRFLILGDD